MKDSDRGDIHGEDWGSPSGPAAVIPAETLFRRHAAWIARFVSRLGMQGQDVEDIVQETFLIAHRHGGYRAGPAKPTTWLAEIAARVASTTRRARGRADATEPAALDEVAGRGADPGMDAERRQSLARVQRALDGLDAEKCALFVRFELDGESCESLADEYGVPIGTIYSRLHTARTQFTDAFAKLERTPSRGGRR